MANRIDATLSGVGAPNDVRASWDAILDEVGASAKLLEIQNALIPPPKCSVQLARACLAMVCASFNTSFATTGQLYQVDYDGHISYRYFASGKERDLVMQLMS
jgi:hypothetical protein